MLLVSLGSGIINFCFISYKITLWVVVIGALRYWSLVYLLKFINIMHFELCVEPPLYRGGFTNKECHRALKQRETDDKQHKTTTRFCGTLIYNRGRRRSKQSCLLFGDVVHHIRYFPLSRIFWGAFWRGALCCLFYDPSEVTLISMKSWKGRGTAS